MSTYQILTKKLNVQSAEYFVQSVQQEGSYYIFAAKHTPYANNSDQIIPQPVDSVDGGTLSVYNDMLFGKRVTTTDVLQVAKRVDWQQGTKYEMYDDTDTLLFTKNYYACVNNGTSTHVYKCLFNNNGANSTVEPSGTETSPFESPEDGYIWKYMYTADDYAMRKFATSNYIPVIANNNSIASAVDGAINIIKVEDGGIGYSNYTTGSFGSSDDIRITGSPYLYGLDSNASNINDFYTNCIIKITSGAAKDEYRIIVSYYIANGQRIITLNEGFTAAIIPTDTYEINPYVIVLDTGGLKQTNCIARAIVSNTSSNTISKIEVLEPGSGYRSAQTVIIQSPTVPVTSNASLRSIISPPGGHGSNPNNELGANYAAVTVKFLENETPFPTLNDYRTIGLLKDPLYANVEINVVDLIGEYAIDEYIFQYVPVTLIGSVNTFSNSTITGTGTFFDTSLVVGDSVIVTDGTSNIFANVIAISSNTSLTLAANAPMTSTGCTIQLARNISPYGKVTSKSTNIINVTDFSTTKKSSTPYLVGLSSSCTSKINLANSNPVITNGRNVENFSKFNQLQSFVGTLITGAFTEDEIITQDSALSYAIPTARFHSLDDNISGPTDIMYITNTRNIFLEEAHPDSDGLVIGAQSAAQFQIAAKYKGDLVPDSGEILYLENLNPITRANNKSETFKLILEF